MWCRPAVLGLAALAVARQAAAQGGWIPPQPPCDVKAGHFRVTSAVVNLQAAAQKPNTRERMLSQTLDVLTRAITADGQDQNPGAWYYLGRYYVEMGDAGGADSAFRRAEALAPQCVADIDGHRNRLWADVVAAGLRNWQENRPDSAKRLLGQAAALRPGHPRAWSSLGELYAAENQVDSAIAHLERAVAAAGRDTAFAEARKAALGGVARLHLGKARGDPAAQGWQRTRFTRDSVQRLLTGDSAILARLEASAASRRARGARLAPADQQAFTRDSTARAQGVAARRGALAALAPQAASDSAGAHAVLRAGVMAFERFLTEYPEATEAVAGLAHLLYQTANAAAAVTVVDRIYGAAGPDLLIDVGMAILRANLTAAGAALLARGVERRAYHRDGLADLAGAYLTLRDSTRLLTAAQRLSAVDPLNRVTLRLLASGWDLRGRRDSAQKYRALADGGQQVEVAMSTFLPDSAGYTLVGVASNGGAVPSTPLRLTFEFVDTAGAVRATQTFTVPAIPPGGTTPIELRAAGQGLAGWRYRPS